jgi:surface protein
MPESIINSNINTAVNAWLDNPAAAEVTYGHIKDWDVSGIDWMFQLFDAQLNTNAENFNDDISNWDTSNVMNMERMFRNCFAFNQNIGNWNTEKVEKMGDMFNWASAFNQPIRGWKPGNLLSTTTLTHNMFSGSTTAMDAAYNPTSGTTGYGQSPTVATFFYQEFQPQPSTTELQTAVADWFTPNAVASYNGVTIEKWDTSQVTDMSNLFKDNTTFNEDISGWNMDNVTVANRADMFKGATSMHITFTNS